MKSRIVSLVALFSFQGFLCLAQENVEVLSDTSGWLAVSLDSTTTLHCRRPCGSQIYDRWLFELPGDPGTPIVISNRHVADSFETENGMKISYGAKDQCVDNFIEYWIRIENFNANVDGLKVTCGYQNDTEPHNSTQSTVIKLGGEISTTMNLTRMVPSGGNITLHCTRVCGEHISSRWRLRRPADTMPTDINENVAIREYFERENNVSLTTRDDITNQCECCGFMEYELQIGNVNPKVDGLEITCGAQELVPMMDPYYPWFAKFSVILIIDTTSEDIMELNLTLSQTSKQLNKCTMERASMRDEIVKLNQTLLNITQQLDQLTKERDVIKVEALKLNQTLSSTNKQLDTCTTGRDAGIGIIIPVLSAAIGILVVVVIALCIKLHKPDNSVKDK